MVGGEGAIVEMMEEEEGGEGQAFGRERQAKVSMGARHAPVPLPGPSLAPHGSSLDPFPYMAFLGAGTGSGRNVALHILRRHPGCRTARVSVTWQLHVAARIIQ